MEGPKGSHPAFSGNPVINSTVCRNGRKKNLGKRNQELCVHPAKFRSVLYVSHRDVGGGVFNVYAWSR